MSENLSLWRRHCKTDPRHTKDVSMRGGFTAINPQRQVEAATTEWGPYGSGWGLRNLNYTLIEPHDMRPSLALICEFWAGDDIKFEIAADIEFAPKSDGYKMLRTLCQSKALSLLGFNADVYSGDWEIPEYRANMSSRFGDQDERKRQALAKIAAADDEKKLHKLEEFVNLQAGEGNLDFVVAEQIRSRISERRFELNGKQEVA